MGTLARQIYGFRNQGWSSALHLVGVLSHDWHMLGVGLLAEGLVQLLSSVVVVVVAKNQYKKQQPTYFGLLRLMKLGFQHRASDFLRTTEWSNDGRRSRLWPVGSLRMAVQS